MSTYLEGVIFPREFHREPDPFRNEEADNIKRAVEAIEAIRKIATARARNELAAIMKRSPAALRHLADEAGRSVPLEDVLIERAFDNYGDYLLSPLDAALADLEDAE